MARVVLTALCIAVWAAAPAAATPNPAELARGNGYAAEEHSVRTADGYILDVFRIRGPDFRPRPRGARPRPVLLLPGMACNAAVWVLLGPAQSGKSGQALAYALADRGYDVWLGSYRGNMYARRHLNYSSETDTAFWEFSFEDVGLYDIPAMVDHVLDVTEKPQLAYIGHSMGSSAMLALASLRPQYAARTVSGAYLLAPAVFLGHTSSAMFNSTMEVLVPLLRMGGYGPLGNGELNTKPWWIRLGMINVCKSFGDDCSFFGGTVQRTEGGVADWTEYVPDSMGVKNLEHLKQLSGAQRPMFRRYNYGAENQKKYGTEEPPEFDLKKVTIPLSLYYGPKDMIVHPEDVEELGKHLPSAARPPYRVPNDDFKHIDFLFSPLAEEQLYNRLLEDMAEDEVHPSVSSAARKARKE